jgi:Na+/H+ antiporter NhaD/arsenite permease-like protein
MRANRTWALVWIAVLLFGAASAAQAREGVMRSDAAPAPVGVHAPVHRSDEVSEAGVAPDIEEALGERLSYWTVTPFILILLGIAIIPLVHGRWWEQNLNKSVVSFLCALPILAYLIDQGPLGVQVLVTVLHEYYAFIVLLVALFTISGGIYLEGDLRATPFVNTVFLGAGAVLASLIGTTGAAMVFIRPLLRANSERKHTTHVFVFFIFLVANIGGTLLPVGDPPLFLGYLYGVPFFWTLRALWPAWLTATAILLAVFYVWDTYAYSRESLRDRKLDLARERRLKVLGRFNFPLLLGVLLSVIYLRKYELAGGDTIDVTWMRQPVMMLLALLSFGIDYRAREQRRREGHEHPLTPRDRNHFSFAPMIEVAVLFIGIFITMIPAICLLKAHGAESGITRPWQFYWLTGGLSSFLDNAPTYATYFALAQGVTKGLLAHGADLVLVTATTGPIAWNILVGISLGAVFMGANTYIGNAPNFMVKSICESAKVRMPSFFGYMLYSICILIPTFLLVMAMYVK